MAAGTRHTAHRALRRAERCRCHPHFTPVRVLPAGGPNPLSITRKIICVFRCVLLQDSAIRQPCNEGTSGPALLIGRSPKFAVVAIVSVSKDRSNIPGSVFVLNWHIFILSRFHKGNRFRVYAMNQLRRMLRPAARCGEALGQARPITCALHRGTASCRFVDAATGGAADTARRRAVYRAQPLACDRMTLGSARARRSPIDLFWHHRTSYLRKENA